MNKVDKQIIKDNIEGLGYKIANVQKVISNGSKMRVDKGQGLKFSDEKRMIAVSIEVDDE